MARRQNWHADPLATLASSLTKEVPRLIKVVSVAEPSVNAGVGVSMVAIFESCWIDPTIDFLVEDQVPEDEKEASKVRKVTARYWLLPDHKLYRRSFGGLYLRCLRPNEVNGLLTKLHEGVCGSHVRVHSLAHQAMTQGFWWPQMHKDAAEYVWKCE